MKTSEGKSTSEIIAGVNPQALGHFKQARAALGNVEALDKKSYETAIAVQFALLGKEVQFKVHAIRLFALGLPKEYVQSIVLAGAGLTMILCDAARAVTWTDEAYDEFRATNEDTARSPSI